MCYRIWTKYIWTHTDPDTCFNHSLVCGCWAVMISPKAAIARKLKREWLRDAGWINGEVDWPYPGGTVSWQTYQRLEHVYSFNQRTSLESCCSLPITLGTECTVNVFLSIILWFWYIVENTVIHSFGLLLSASSFPLSQSILNL